MGQAPVVPGNATPCVAFRGSSACESGRGFKSRRPDSNGEPLSVLLVADLFYPLDDVTVEMFHNREMRLPSF